MRKTGSVLAAIACLFASLCKAQYIVQQLDNSSGLSNSCINSIACDRESLVWFGTWDGLNFFDGDNIRVFNYEKNTGNRRSIACNVIYQVAGDHARNIWLGTVEGVSRYDKNSGMFYNYFYSPSKAVSNGYTVAVSPTGDVFAARRTSSQLYVYNRAAGKFRKVDIDGLQHFMLLQIFFDDSGCLWLLKDNGILESFRLVNGKFYKRQGYHPVSDVAAAFYCNHHVFYQNKNNSLFRFADDLLPQRLIALPHEIRAMNFFKNRYFLAWSSKGVGEFDDSFRQYSDLARDAPLVQNVRVTSVMTNGAGVLWLGTDGNGVLKVTRKENYFGLVKQQGNGQGFHIPVRAFCEVGGKLWIGTKGNGIITLRNWDRDHVTFSSIIPFRTNVDLLDNCVYAIVKDKNGLVYIGSDAPGITVYNPSTKKFIRWSDIKGASRFAGFGSVHCILLDKDSTIWLGLNEGGLVHLQLGKTPEGDLEVRSLHQYQNQDDNSGPATNVIYSLAQGDDGMLWIGCRYGGLSVFNKNTGKFRTLKAFTYEGSLSNNDVLSVYIDKAGRLWVGTSFGLNCVPERLAARGRAPVFQKFYVDNGLPNNTIHAIAEDKPGNIWISTNKGLARIDPALNKVVQYKESDGLQSNEFSDNAVWKNNAGMLFFGGIYGFNYFQPEKIHLSSVQPNLLLTDVHFAGRDKAEQGLFVLQKTGKMNVRHFEMAPSDDYFELNVQPISFLHSQKCQYAYFLKGNDRSWHFLGKEDRIIYNNLSPGSYTLMIKWSNGEGAWTKGITAFSLTIHQYFWLQPFAFFIYAAVIFLLGYFYFRYRRNKFLMRQELKMEHLLREKDEQVHQAQLNFFTNIAHELQTPLTLILAAVDRYLFKSKKAQNQAEKHEKYLSIVQHEASRLHYLVQQLLEFRKVQEGHLRHTLECVDLSALMTDIGSLFSTLTEEKKLDFSYEIEAGLVVTCDRDKIEKVVYNLLSNAFKYTGPSGRILFAVHVNDEQQLEIDVANSGCKIAEEEANRLFDRFFVADARDSRQSSTGIGLAFTQQLVQLMGGAINVTCTGGWISFRAVLPFEKPDESRITACLGGDKAEKPSYLLAAMSSLHKKIDIVSVADNNKRSLVRSFEQENRHTVLVVEDDQLIRYLLKDILGDKYIVYEACTGVEALDVVRRSAPDIIVSDVLMPDMNGLELCQIIKNTDETCQIPFVLLSARTAVQQMTEGYQCGADAYIPKPFQEEHLLVRIEKLLAYRQKLQQVFLDKAPGLSAAFNPGLEEQDKSFIEKVTRVIEENIEEDLDSAYLENAMNMSRMQLYRKIKTFSDMTPAELIRHIRLSKASSMLKNSELTVSEIFYQTGFNNKSYFFREFKKMFNCSPNDYRARHKLPVRKI